MNDENMPLTPDAAPAEENQVPAEGSPPPVAGNPAPKKPRAPRKPRLKAGPMTTSEVGAPAPAKKPRAPRAKKSAQSVADGPGAVPLLPAPAPPGSSPEERAAAEASVARLTDALQSVRAGHDELQRRHEELVSRFDELARHREALQGQLPPVEQTLAELERRAAALGDATPMRKAFDELAAEVEALARRMQDVHRQVEAREQALADLERRAANLPAEQLQQTLSDLGGRLAELQDQDERARRLAGESAQSLQALQLRWETLRGQWETVHPAIERAADQMAEADRRADAMYTTVEEAGRRFEALMREKEEMERSLERLRGERESLAGSVAALHDEGRRAVESFRAEMAEISGQAVEAIQSAIDQARAAAARSAAEASPTASSAASSAASSDPRDEALHATFARALSADESALPEVDRLPPESLSGNVDEQRLRYLNDARAAVQEQESLFQQLLDESHAAWSRADLERALAEADRRREAIEERIVALGGEPAGGRGLLSHVATHLWDVLQKPASPAGDPVEDLLKALCTVELEVGVYVALNALGSAMGDYQTVRLAAVHHAQVQDLARRIRAHIAVPAVESAMRPDAVADAGR